MAAPTKEQLPTLAGKKIKTRKRDEKVKYDPTSFAEQVIAGLNETDGTMEEIGKYLDSSGAQMDYRLCPLYSSALILKLGILGGPVMSAGTNIP